MQETYTQILESILEYQKENHISNSPSEFAHWLIEREEAKSKPKATANMDLISVNEIEEEISRLLVVMYRYSKSHLKTYLADFEEVNQEDFTYIFALKRATSLTKIQLIEMNIHDKTTGLEVIRRLVKSGIVEESKDKIDKRSIRLSLTPKGEETFFSLKTMTRKIAQLITCELALEEKNDLYHILTKLDAFHHPLYSSKQKEDIDVLLALSSAPSVS